MGFPGRKTRSKRPGGRSGSIWAGGPAPSLRRVTHGVATTKRETSLSLLDLPSTRGERSRRTAPGPTPHHAVRPRVGPTVSTVGSASSGPASCATAARGRRIAAMDPRRQRHPGGRPRLPDHERRTHEVRVFMNDAEKSRVAARAARLGLKPAVMLREEGVGNPLPAPPAGRAFDAAAIAAISSAWTQASGLRREIRAIGINLNQVAHHANAGKFTPGIADAAIAQVGDLGERLKRLCEQAEAALEAVDKAAESDPNSGGRSA